MSQGLMVYLVPGEEVAGIIGCGDQALLQDVLEKMSEDIEELEQHFYTAHPKDGPGLTFDQAMRELFAGAFSRPDRAFVYAYAFEEVCRYFGRWLGNRYFARCRYEWFKRLDELLVGGGVPLQFDDLLGRLPAALPDPRGSPCLGHWRADEAAGQPGSLIVGVFC